MAKQRTILKLVTLFVLTAACWPQRSQREYFDGHNHNYSGILPYYAYANLEAFLADPNDPGKVDLQHRRALWVFLAKYQYQGSRFSPGALETVRLYGKDPASLSEAEVNGALARVLTTTPWTDFDSAYAFRGAPIYAYLQQAFQDDARMNKAVCDAAIIELAVTHTGYSEQFINFLGGWGPAPSAKLDNIRCFLKEPAVLTASGKFKALGLAEPKIKSLLMTNTSEFGAVTKDGPDWIQYGVTGQCAGTKPQLYLVPEDIRNGLLGRNSDGAEIIRPEEEAAFFDGVIGIDTAGPEFTCFTAANAQVDKGAGMENYKRLVRAVYSASRERRGAGWHGKLLVHTHVGEGGVRYAYDTADPFRTFPTAQMDAATGVPVHIEQSRENIRRLLQAVRELKTEIKDLDNFVVFRFGHVTHAEKQDAMAMKELGIEADINLESNIATRAYWTKQLAKPAPEPLTEQQQFEYNDLVAKVLASGHAAETLADHSLKYMLEAGVRTLLGSDGGGEEHSSIAREYSLAGELIAYWKAHDEDFKRSAPRDLSVRTIDRNVEEHLKDMRADKKVR
ncbi:MAG TPA: hypothetical protein VN176_05160 [Verrucomicrobiae bacterium]|nr:hypothetical protein [Verrucomicrobiae bacterium]